MSRSAQTQATSKDAIIKALAKLFGGIHRMVYRLTGGTIGGNFRGSRILLLTTIGRKTGKVRTWPPGVLSGW